MAEKKHIQHLRSKVVENGKPKLPTSDALMFGEIAVNYAEGYETLSIENSASGITTFSSDDVYTKNKLGELFSGDTTVANVISGKQDTLVSGTNIKTINNQTLLGSGNITISGGGSVTIDSALSTTSENPVQNKVITNALNNLDGDVSDLKDALLERIEKPSTVSATSNKDYMSLSIPYVVGWDDDKSYETNEVEFSAATSERAGVMSAEDKKTLDSLSGTVSSKADSINIADYFPNGAKSGETMPRRAVYHYNGNILHSRYILIDEGDTGGTEGDEEECLIFCYHSDTSTDVHGTYYYAFYSQFTNYQYCYTWTYANAPKYIKQAFGEYTESDITQVLTFDNPSGDDKEKEVYERVIERLSETPGEVVPVVWYDYSDGFEIFGAEGGWLHGCAYQRENNVVVIDMYGVAYEDDDRAFVEIKITKNNNAYSSTQRFKHLDATANHNVNGLMSAEDKITLDSLSGVVSSKADTTAVTQVNNALTAHTANTNVHVTASEKTTWNSKSDFSGDYNDLTNKPTIPSYTAGSGITISNDTISAKIWSGTKAAYEALTTKDSDTIYLIYNE